MPGQRQTKARRSASVPPSRRFVERGTFDGGYWAVSSVDPPACLVTALLVAEVLETTRIHRVAGLTGARTTLVTACPFRAPHHTTSDVRWIGGGGQGPMPGEGSRAPHGVLFLDELPEVWRPPLENDLV